MGAAVARELRRRPPRDVADHRRRQLVRRPAALTGIAAWSVVWGGLSLVGVLVAARLAFGTWLTVNSMGVGVAAMGIGLSATVNGVLQQWEIARFGIPEPAYVGWTAGLFAMLVGLAVSAFGVFVSPRQVIGWPLSAVLLGSAGVVFIVLSNMPGLLDGIAGDSWPLAVWIGLSALYAVSVTGLALRHGLRESRPARADRAPPTSSPRWRW